MTGKQSFTRLEVGTDTANATVTVQAEADMFAFPLDASGAGVVAEGQFRVLAASVGDYALVAVGVELRKAGGVCARFPLAAQTQDMDQESEFEGAFMGSGLVTLQPGEQMHLHSTNHSTEIVTVLEGTVTFLVYYHSDAPTKYVLPKHSAIMVPHSTMHSVANTGGTAATYLFVHAIAPVAPAGTL